MYREHTDKATYITGSSKTGKRLPIKLKNQYTVNISRDHNIRAFDRSIPILDVSVSPIFWKGLYLYNVYTADVKIEYQGNGLCKAVYIALLQNNIALCSNGSHSLGARKTWARVAANRNVNAYGFDPNKGMFWIVRPNKRKSEIVSRKNYPAIYGKSEIGIILVRKGSDQDKLIKTYLKEGKMINTRKKDFLKNSSFRTVGTNL